MRQVIYILGLVSLLLHTGCKKEDDFRGPETIVSSGDFELVTPLTISDKSIDFSKKDTVTLEALFNEVSDYKIVITGQKTGAVKTIEGTGDQLKAYWNGTSDGRFFKEETCQFSLYVRGINDPIQEDTLEIVKRMDAPGNLIASFEPLGQNLLVGFWEADVNGEKTKISCNRTADVAIEGDYAFRLEGVNHLNTTNRFLGVAYSKPIIGENGVSNSGAKYRVGTENPEEVWFNVWVYGNGNDDSYLSIKFMQDDNESGDHDGTLDNGFEYNLKDLSFSGWKLFSVRYDQLTAGGNADYGGSGDKVHRPHLISQIEFALWSNVNGRPVRATLDYPIFTLNAPLGQ